MPTNVRRRNRKKQAPISPDYWALLNDDAEWEPLNAFSEIGWHDKSRELWPQWRDTIMATWPRLHPGTRPSCWWWYDAPRLPASQLAEFADTYVAPDMIEHRLKVSGSGEPAWNHMCYAPAYTFGIPGTWWCDVDDPPVFESQYAYLARHGLLSPKEKKPKREPAAYIALHDAAGWTRCWAEIKYEREHGIDAVDPYAPKSSDRLVHNITIKAKIV